jgi:hypothetical protein
VHATAREQPAPGFDVRPLESGDGAFVFATWLNHLKGSSTYGKALERGAFFKTFHRTIEGLLKRPTCRTLVASPLGEPEIILGYLVTDAVGERPVVHFAFVKGPFRGHGVMRALWSASGLDGNECIWSMPTDAESWVRRKFPQLEVLDFWR